MNPQSDISAKCATRGAVPRKRFFSDNWHFNVSYVLLLIAVATLPFTNWALLPVACLMFVNWMVEWNWKEKWSNLRHNASTPTIIILFSVYLLAIYGFFLSCNKGKALAGIECYLWFLAAPLYLLTCNRKDASNERIHTVFMFFALSTFVHLCILFVIAIQNYVQTGDDIFLYYEKFSIIRHPSYVAMYATFSFYFLLDFINRNRMRLSIGLKIPFYVMMTVMSTGVFFLQSKAGILVFCILAVVWLVYLLFVRSANSAALLGVIIVVVSVGITLHEKDLLPIHRFKDTIEDVNRFKSNRQGSGSSEIRLTVWRSTLEICRKNMPWGVGTGDATDELEANAVRNDYKNLVGRHFNAHNQYLQSLLSTGIPGIMVVIAYTLLPLVVGMRKKDALLFSFSIILILNVFVESMFEVRGGVAFIAIMHVLLLLRLVPREPSGEI